MDPLACATFQVDLLLVALTEHVVFSAVWSSMFSQLNFLYAFIHLESVPPEGGISVGYRSLHACSLFIPAGNDNANSTMFLRTKMVRFSSFLCTDLHSPPALPLPSSPLGLREASPSALREASPSALREASPYALCEA